MVTDGHAPLRSRLTRHWRAPAGIFAQRGMPAPGYVLRGCVRIRHSLSRAPQCPAAAAREYQRQAAASSASSMRPLSSRKPMAKCASTMFCAAAAVYQRMASRGLHSTPCPSSWRSPTRYCVRLANDGRHDFVKNRSHGIASLQNSGFAWRRAIAIEVMGRFRASTADSSEQQCKQSVEYSPFWNGPRSTSGRRRSGIGTVC